MTDQRQVNEVLVYIEYVNPERQVNEAFAYIEYAYPARQVDETFLYVEYVFPAREANEVFAYIEYIEGAVNHQHAYLEGTVTSSSDHQPAYLKGQSTISDNQPTYTRGSSSLSDNQIAYLEGVVSTSDNQSSFLQGKDTLSDNQVAYTRGGSTLTKSYPAYIGVAGNTVTDNIPAYLGGKSTQSDNQPAYTRGKLTSSDNIPAYMFGALGISDNLPAYIPVIGGEVVTQPVYMYGYPVPGTPNFVNIEITLEGTSITEKVLDYSREQNICNGVATLRVSTVPLTTNPKPYDEIILYEDGVRKGKFYVKTWSTDHTGKIIIESQDESKKLMDYFVTEQEHLDYVTTARYWIEKYFAEAHVRYSIRTSDSGAPVTPGSVFGFQSAYDIIMQLLQMSNWYMYFDANSRAIIGKLSVASGRPHKTVTDETAMDIQTNTNDKMLRNRAVVWGGADIITGQWIYADISVITRYNYDSNDLRTVVLSNNYIQTYGQAYTLARQILNEFNTLTNEKTVKIAGSLTVYIGDYVMISSKYYRGGGIVTTVASELSEQGLTTVLVLDQRCPRLFAFFSDFDDYVYVGTEADGVWKKPLDSDGWVNYSDGITDLGIRDLSINQNVFGATTTAGYLYHRTILSSWAQFNPASGQLETTVSGVIVPSGIFEPSGIVATCVTVGKVENSIYAGFTTDSGALQMFGLSGISITGYLIPEGTLSWVVKLANTGSYVSSNLVHFQYNGADISEVAIVDIDNNGVENILSVLGPGSGFLLVATGIAFNQGYFLESQVPSTSIYAIGPKELENPIYDPEWDEWTYPPDGIDITYLSHLQRGSEFTAFGEEWVVYITTTDWRLHEVRMNEVGDNVEELVYDTFDIGDYSEAYCSQTTVFTTDNPNIYRVTLWGNEIGMGEPSTYHFKVLSVNKETLEVSLIDDSDINPGLSYAGDNFEEYPLRVGELFVNIIDEKHWDGTRRSKIIRGQSYNLYTGESKGGGELWIDKNTPEDDVGADGVGRGFISYTQDGNNRPIIHWRYITHMVRGYGIGTIEIDLVQYASDVYASTMDVSVLMTTMETLEGTLGQTDYLTDSYAWKQRGWDINKDSTLWKWIYGRVVGGDTIWEDYGIVLGSASGNEGFYCADVDEYPLAIQSPYRSLAFTEDGSHGYIFYGDGNWEDGTFVELQIPIDAEFEETSSYAFQKDSFNVETDYNDGCIYGIVLKYTPGYENYGWSYFCGWKQNGEMIKRSPPLIYSGPVTDQLYVMNQFAVLRFYIISSGYYILLIRFAEPSINIYGLGTICYILRQIEDDITLLYTYPEPLKVDISKSAPTVTFTPSVSGQTFSHINTSWTNGSGDYTPLLTTFPVYDVRTFDVGDLNQFYVESGTVTESGLGGFRYLAMATDSGIVIVDAATNSGVAMLASTSGFNASGISESGLGFTITGAISRIETSNYSATTPYFFAAPVSSGISESGISSSGISESGTGRFYQRDPGSYYWTDYSSGLPGSQITIIRVDDRI